MKASPQEYQRLKQLGNILVKHQRAPVRVGRKRIPWQLPKHALQLAISPIHANFSKINSLHDAKVKQSE